MKILGICGSPRHGGNTEILLERALEGASAGGAEGVKIILDDLDIHPIREVEYDTVDSTGLSPVCDDMHRIYAAVEECGALILASPIFFGTVSTQLKTMIDRFQCVWIAKVRRGHDIFTRKKPGAFLCTAASHRKDFFRNARFVVKNLFHIVAVDYAEELFCPGLDPKGAVLDHPDFLSEAYALGRRLAGRSSRTQGER